MKQQIRNGVFETNSSSTHALCIGKKYNEKQKKNIVNFGVLSNSEFRTAKEDYQYRADKLFAGIIGKYDYDNEKAFIRLGKLMNLLMAASIQYTLNLSEDYIENNLPYVESSAWVDFVLENENNLLNYLFSEHSGFVVLNRDEVFLSGGLENIFDKNECDIYETTD